MSETKSPLRKKTKRSPLRSISKKPKLVAQSKKKPSLLPEGPIDSEKIRKLRGLGHSLDPVVQIGKAGVTEALVRATLEQLRAHELIKVKLPEEGREERLAIANDLATRSGAVLAQVLGRTALLFRRRS